MERLICIIIGYVFGLFQTSYIYGRLHGIDIRKCGSGNAGTTNMLRTLGTKAGAITLLGDAFKCVIAVLVVRMLFAGKYPDMLPLLSIIYGSWCRAWTQFPVLHEFQGWKRYRSDRRIDSFYELADDITRYTHIRDSSGTDPLCVAWVTACLYRLSDRADCVWAEWNVRYVTGIFK